MALRIAAYPGDRGALAELFALADDSPKAIAGYRDRGTALVAKDGEEPAGLALVIIDRAHGVAELKTLAVAPRRQRTGLGTKLVEAAMDAARKGGARSMIVTTASADIGNLRFYQRVGFRMNRIVRDVFTPAAGYPAGTMIDGIVLRDQVVFDRPI